MSDEERSASEHRSVLKGMTSAEAKALVAACDGLSDNGGTRDKLLALAALGAKCVGAKEAWAFIPPSGVAGGNYLGEMYLNPKGSLLPQANNNPKWARRVLVMEGE